MDTLNHDIPIIEINVRDLVADVGPAQFWNAEDPVLSHLFNAIVFVDKAAVDYTLWVVDKVLEENDKLDANLHKRLWAYREQAKIRQKQNQEHLDLLLSQGYKDTVTPFYERKLQEEMAAFDMQHATAKLNSYCWLSNSVCEFTLASHHFLSMAAVKPAITFRWCGVIDAIHNGTGFLLCEAFKVPFLKRMRGLLSVDVQSKTAFLRQFFYMLKKDNCFTWKKLPTTIKKFWELFVMPFSGYEWVWLRYRLAYLKSNANGTSLDHRGHVLDFLTNYRQYVEQVNPAVNNKAFFSGEYFSKR